MRNKILKFYPTSLDSKSDRFIVHSRLARLASTSKLSCESRRVKLQRSCTYFIGVFFFLAIFFTAPNFASAAPSISSAPATITDGQSVTIEGAEFGVKTIAAPKYFDSLENEAIGQMPTGQVTNISTTGTVQDNLSHSGLQSLESDFCADLGPVNWSIGNVYLQGFYIQYPSGGAGGLNNGPYYKVLNYVSSSGLNGETPDTDVDNYEYSATLPATYCADGRRVNHYLRTAIDLESTGSGTIFMSTWMYLDKGTTSSTYWQWKNLSTTACDNLYACAVTNKPFILFENWTGTNGIWSNTAAPIVYVGGMIGGPTFNPGPPPDLYLFDQWQRVDLYVKRNSVDNASDGIIYFNRIGRSSPIVNAANVKTHASGDNLWRYMVLNNGIESVRNGYVDLKTYMDDIYVDTTQARIEMCDASTWAARTHCEIQKPTAWPTLQDPNADIAIDVNQGTFAPSSTAYLYVVDENGDVNSDGYSVTLTAQSDTTAPSAPGGLSVQ